jgi:spore germination protein
MGEKGTMKSIPVIVRFLLTALSVLSLTGCWSSHEIEDVSLGVGMAFDANKKESEEKMINEKGQGYSKADRITSTFQLITPQIANSSSKEGGGSSKQSYINISETGDSILQEAREISLRTDLPFNATHMKVVVIGEELAQSNNLQYLFDMYLRDNDFRPSCLVFISKGKASDTLISKTPGEVPAFRMFGIVDNAYRSSRILPPVSLIKLDSKLQSGSSFLLQNVISANGQVKFAGAAVIKGKTKKLCGFLNEDELEAVIWLTGKGEDGVLKSVDPQTNRLIVYEVKSMKSKIRSHVKKNQISFDVNIESEGRLAENWTVSGTPFENSFLKKAEELTEMKIKQIITQAVKKMQKEYRVDAVGFGNRLKIEHPNVWEKVKNNWDQTFIDLPINYHINVIIKDYGGSGHSK